MILSKYVKFAFMFLQLPSPSKTKWGSHFVHFLFCMGGRGNGGAGDSRTKDLQDLNRSLNPWSNYFEHM